MTIILPKSVRGRAAVLWGLVALGASLLVIGVVPHTGALATDTEDPAPPLSGADIDMEKSNVDECEDDEPAAADDLPDAEQGRCGDGIRSEFLGMSGGESSAAPEPRDPYQGPAGEGAGETESGVAGSGKKHEERSLGGESESAPGPEGSGTDGTGPGEEEVPDFGQPKKPGDHTPSEGDDGDVGGADDGDGDGDPKGGETDGFVTILKNGVTALGQTPPPHDQNPVGGAKGRNPGFLNSPVVFRYRSADTGDGVFGVGWDANILERLIISPMRNTAASVAWYPGNGACHYFYGPPNGPFAPEASVQDTHSLVFDPNSQAGRYVLSDKYGNRTLFDVAGRLSQKIDRIGNSNAYTRDPATGRLLTISSSYGHPAMWSFAYHPTGRIKSATDYSGRMSQWGFDAGGRMSIFAGPASAVHPAGKVFQYQYWTGTGNPNIDGKMKGIVDPTGTTRVEWEYDAMGYANKLKRGNGMHELTISRNGNTRDVTDFNGNLRRYTFQPGLHYPTRVELFTRGLRPGDPASYVWEYEFNPQRQVTKAIMPSGKSYEFEFDANFNRTRRRVKSANGSQVADWTWTYGAYNLATSATDAIGSTWTYTRNVLGQMTAKTSPATGGPASQTLYEYNSYGQVQKITNPAGRSVTYHRFAGGPFHAWVELVEINDPGSGGGTCGNGTTYLLSHNTRGYPLTLADPEGGVVTITRDDMDRVTGVATAGAVPSAMRMTYSQVGLPQAVERENRDETGALDPVKPWITEAIARDPRRRVISVTSDFDATTTAQTLYESDGLGRVTLVTTPEARVLASAYDERGYLMSSTVGTTQPLGAAFSYHPSGKLKEIRDGLGNATTFGADAFDRITSSTAPTGEVYSKVLDPVGHVLSEELRDSASVLFGRLTMATDARHRITSVSMDRFGHGGPAETVTFLRDYDALSGLTRTTTPLGRTYSNTYFGCGRPRTSLDDQTGGLWEYDYDLRGLPTSAKRTETEGGTTKTHRWERSYDVNGLVVESREIDADDPTHILKTNYLHDGNGRLAQVIGPRGETMRYAYNYAGLVTSVTQYERVAGQQQPTAHVTAYVWDKDGNLLSVTDPAGSRTEYEYTEHGLLKKRKQPDGSSSTYLYDVAGRLASVTDNNGTVVTNGYDTAGRLVTRSVVPAQGVLGTTIENYVYDPVGRLISASDDDSVVEMTYDSVGNVLTERQGPSLSQLVNLQAAYDREGSLTSLVYPGGMLAPNWTGDAAGRFSSITQGSATLAQRSYRRTSLVAGQTTVGGLSTDARSYDGFGRMTSLAFRQTPASGPAVTLFDVQYGYDDGHRRLYERRLHAANSGDLYTYDDLGRTSNVLRGVADPLAELQTPGSQAFATNVAYSFNAVGNRTQVVATPMGGTPATTTYTGNALHQYTAIGGLVRTHDLNGNLLSNGTHSFKYDYKNRIVEARSVATGGVIATYQYDALGRRTAKTVGGTLSRYLYWGEDLVEVRDASATVTHQFVHGDGVDDLVLMSRLDSADYDQDGNTSEHLLFTFHLAATNSVRAVTDSSGALVETYTYDEYGTATIRNAAGQVVSASLVGNFFAFTAREFDGETGLMHYRARTYDPASGSFLQRDPLEHADGYNLYGYVGNAPFNLRDPYGLSVWSTVQDAASWSYRKILAPAGRGVRSAAVGVAHGAVQAVGAVGGGLVTLVGGTPSRLVTDPGDGSLLGSFRAGVASPGATAVGIVKAPWRLGEEIGNIGMDVAENQVTVEDAVERSAKACSELFLMTSPLMFRKGAARGGAKYGATPKGRPLTKHYGTETGPKRNIPGSVVDNTIDTTPGVPGRNGTTVHYDPANNVTVVTGDGGSIVSAHKGKP